MTHSIKKCSLVICITLLSSSLFAQNAVLKNDKEIVNYVIQNNKNEVWTPTDNPVVKDLGSNAIYAIDVNNIKIYPGSSLTINGLVLRMKANSTINVYTMPDLSSKGQLILSNSKLTNQENGILWGGVHVFSESSALKDSVSATREQVVLVTNSSIQNAKKALSVTRYRD